MSLRNIGIVYRKELTEAIRDRRTLISTLIVPLVLFPSSLPVSAPPSPLFVGKAQEEVPKVMLRGGLDSPAIVAGLKKLDKIEIVPETPNWKDQIINKEVRAAIEIPPGFQAAVAEGKPDTVTILKYQGEMKSEIATARLKSS